MDGETFLYSVVVILTKGNTKMTFDEEMAYEDSMGFPRSTRQPYHCSKCGKQFNTRDIYLWHKEHNCKGKPEQLKKQKTQIDIEREKRLNQSLKQFHEKVGLDVFTTR